MVAYKSGATAPLTKEIVYRDLDITFQPHPVTGRVSTLTNNAAVKRALRNLIFTKRYERPYQPLLSSDVTGRLFENITRTTKEQIEKDVRVAIENFEPRVDLIDVIAYENNTDNNEIRVDIVFRVINQTDPTQLTLILERVR